MRRTGSLIEMRGAMRLLKRPDIHWYAVSIHQNFWDVWKGLGIKGYSEIVMKQRNTEEVNEEEDERYIPFYRVIERDNEDEFIEFLR